MAAAKTILIEHGVCLAEFRARSIAEAIRKAEAILTNKTERAYLAACGNWFVQFRNGAWERRALNFNPFRG
jgi:hypothetical protein